jgi:hypothetical protein
MFENRVLRRIFRPKKYEVTGGWRKLHNEELHDLYSSPSISRIIKSRRMRWAGLVTLMRAKRSAYRLLVRKPKEKDHWEEQDVGGGMTDLVEIGVGGVDWIGLAEERDN